MSAPSPWTVVVARAWWSDGQVRVRLLRGRESGPVDQVVVASAEAAAEVILGWLTEEPTS